MPVGKMQNFTKPQNYFSLSSAFSQLYCLPVVWPTVSPASRNQVEGGGKKKGMGSLLARFVLCIREGNFSLETNPQISLGKSKSHDHC